MSLDLQLPEYNQETFSKKYGELLTYKVEIPGNLEKIGYLGINELMSKIQGYMTRVNELLVEANQLHSVARAFAKSAKYAFEAKRAAKLGALSKGEYESIKILEAQVDTELEDDKRLMQRAELATGLFAAYLKSVEGTYENLKDVKDTLDKQSQIYKRLVPLPMY